MLATVAIQGLKKDHTTKTCYNSSCSSLKTLYTHHSTSPLALLRCYVPFFFFFDFSLFLIFRLFSFCFHFNLFLFLQEPQKLAVCVSVSTAVSQTTNLTEQQRCWDPTHTAGTSERAAERISERNTQKAQARNGFATTVPKDGGH